MRRQKETVATAKPIMRFRSMITGMFLLVLLVVGPLLAVWKQVYINEVSLQMDSLSDSLIVLKKEIAKLELMCERFSGTERIEKIAREKLNLEYPVSNQITIVKIHSKSKECWPYRSRNILAILRKAIIGDRG